jgi:hypothetical protein
MAVSDHPQDREDGERGDQRRPSALEHLTSERPGDTMALMIARAPGAHAYRYRLAVMTALLVTGASVSLAGCGGSSKPAYCSDVTKFKNSVEQLKNVTSPSGLVSQVEQLASTGQTALSAVKSHLAPHTSAVKSSLAALENSVKQLSSSSTRASALAAMPGDVMAVINAAESFANAAKPKCS